MADIKKYSIQINGLTESIDAVKSLNEQLSNLESRIKALSSSSVKVGTSSGGGSKTSSSSALNEEEKLLKQINQLEEKQVAYSKEIYQNYLAAKDVLKETVNDQKQLAAVERVQANTYSNTMEGIKQKLADLKSVHFTTGISTDEFKNQTKDINALTEKLKQLEQEYGVFSRNVGNYASAFGKFKVEVGGVVSEFDTAKQAAKTLSNELATLQAKKDQGMLLSAEELKRFEELPEIVAQVKSSIQDAGKPMDALMDSMQSLVAIAQAYKGFGAFFGLDNDKIQRSIQKLVGLQNAMQGVQKIAAQFQSTEFLGGWASKGSVAIDKIVDSIFGVEKASKAATVAANSLKVALKGIGIGLIIAGVVELIDLIEKWSEKQDEAAKKAEEAAEKVQKAVDEQRQTYVNASATYMNTASRLSYLQTEYKKTNDELRKTNIIKEAAEEFKKLGISIKNLNDAQRIFVQDGDKVIELLKLQGDSAAIAALRMEAYKKSFQMLMENGYDANAASILAGNNKTVLELDKRLGAVTNQINTIKGKLKIGVEDVGKGVSKSVEQVHNELVSLELRLMKDGLNKTLMQLEEEKRQTINKYKSNGRAVASEIEKIENTYSKLRLKAINDYLEKLTKSVEESQKKIEDVQFSIDTKSLEVDLQRINEEIRHITDDIAPINNILVNRFEYSDITSATTKERMSVAASYTSLFEEAKSKDEKAIKEYYKWLEEYVSSLQEEVKNELGYTNLATGEFEVDYAAAEQYLEEHYKKEIDIINQYGYLEEASMKESFDARLDNQRAYYDKYLAEVSQALAEQENIERISAGKIKENELKANLKRYEETDKTLRDREKDIKDSIAAIEKVLNDGNHKITDDEKATYEKYKENLKKTQEQIKTNSKQYATEVERINQEHLQNLKQIENKYNGERREKYESFYNEQVENYRDFISKINIEAQKQPVSGWTGIVNLSATKRNYDEIINATKTAISNIDVEINKVNEDFKKGLLTPAAYNAIIKQLQDIKGELNLTLQFVEEESKNRFSKFFQSLQDNLNELANAFSIIMNAVWNAEDIAFEKEQEQIDKTNDALADALDKQKEIVEQHKSAIDDIESELATARGDRRQHLIDQINAEIAAQREAQKEEQRIKKQQEAQVRKQDELDKKRKKAEYDRNIAQIIVSGAMAAANGFATQPFIPTGLAMGALATSLVAAQLAIAMSNKPYAKGGQLDGGVAVGNRHRDGGIKVLGGRAEIEGGEFITNRISTEMNTPLLEFINSKKKRIDVSDLIEFYSSKPVRKAITSSSPKAKFADGGYIPTLSSDYDFNDRLITAFEDYSKRPVVVSVVDINERQTAVKNVQVLAGLE